MMTMFADYRLNENALQILLLLLLMILQQYYSKKNQRRRTKEKGVLFLSSSSSLLSILSTNTSTIPTATAIKSDEHDGDDPPPTPPPLLRNATIQTRRISIEHDVPNDIQVQIMSFLHPRDVVMLSCVSKEYHTMINTRRAGNNNYNNATSFEIWTTLWYRDYGWILHQWQVGKQAYERSQKQLLLKQHHDHCDNSIVVCSKEFYFIFSYCYLDYVLAGHNTMSSCYVGIHSNIYNVTSYLTRHPGSPSILTEYGGKDATTYFNTIGHSTWARKQAMSMAVIVDRSSQNTNYNDCGLYPTIHMATPPLVNKDHPDHDPSHRSHHYHRYRFPSQRLKEGADNLLRIHPQKRMIQQRRKILSRPINVPTIRTARTAFNEKKRKQQQQNSSNISNTLGGGTLYRIKKLYEKEKSVIHQHLEDSGRKNNKYSAFTSTTSTSISDRQKMIITEINDNNVHPYYDPFTKEWIVWYTNDTDDVRTATAGSTNSQQPQQTIFLPIPVQYG